MKKSKLLAALLIAVTMTSCGENDTSGETETTETSVTTVSETTEASTVNTEKNEETTVTTTQKKIVTSAKTTVTLTETTPYDPANAMELTVDNLLLTAEGWVYHDGFMDESASYFFCILEDGTVYTMTYRTSESDTFDENAFTRKLYSCDNSVWDLAENVKAVGNIFSQMSYEMLMEDFAAIDWDSDYYVRPYDETVPAVNPEFNIIVYLYPLRDGKKTAVFASADGRHILDDNAAEFLRRVAYSDVYGNWTWQLWDFSKGNYGDEQ